MPGQCLVRLASGSAEGCTAFKHGCLSLQVLVNMLASQASPPQLQETLAAVLCSMASSSPDSCMLMLQGGLAKCAASLLGALSSDELKAQVATLIQYIAQRLLQAQVRCSPCSAHRRTSAASGAYRRSSAVNIAQSPHHRCQSCMMALTCTVSLR